MSEKSLEEEIKQKAQENRKLARYMSSTQDLVEEQIRKAREKGAFDNLEGEGKPLDLEENPYVPAEMHMAYKVLKDNGFAPYWIELGKEIDQDTKKVWEQVAQFQRYCAIFWVEKPGVIARGRFQKKKELFYYERKLDFENINKKIINYNLHCPTFRVGRAGLEVEAEMDKVIRLVEQAIENALQS